VTGNRISALRSVLCLFLAFSGTLLAEDAGPALPEENPPSGLSVSAGSQTTGANPPPPEGREGEEAVIRPYGFRQIGLDARYLATRPLHLDRRGWMKVAATLGTAAILYADRDVIRDGAQERRTPGRDDFLQKPRIMGKAAFAPSLALISYGASFATHDDREKETAVLLLESMAFTGAAVGLGQSVLSTRRPEEGNDIRFFSRRGHGLSGDAGLAASVVPVLKNQYLLVRPGDGGGRRFWKRTATGLLYTGALLTGYQRINNDKHWAPDVFLGLVTGFTVGQILCDSHDRTRQERRSRVALTAVPGGIGLRITLGQEGPDTEALDSPGAPR